MSNFKSVNAIDLAADRAVMNEIIGKTYKGLPKCSENEAGVVKVDGATIMVNDKGQLTIKVENYEKLFNHIKNAQIHLSPEDTDNLNSLRKHLKGTSAHFLTGEKDIWIDILDEAEKHYNSKHLTKEEVKETAIHINDESKHFDNEQQKNKVVNLLEEAMMISQGIPDRILVTDSKGNVSVSTISSQILGCISEINSGTFSYFDDRYAHKVHAHDEFDKFGGHIEDKNVHFTSGEKESIITDIADLKDYMKNESDIYATHDDLRGKADEDHNHDSDTLYYKNTPLDTILSQILDDINTLKSR